MQLMKTNLVFACFLILFCGCAGLTNSQRVLWGIEIYNSQYDSYLDAVINPDLPEDVKKMLKENPSLITEEFINKELSEDKRKILRVKKDILIELKPLVLMAAEYQKTGQLPSNDVQNKLTELINRLVELSED